jgi:hypothetical protein
MANNPAEASSEPTDPAPPLQYISPGNDLQEIMRQNRLRIGGIIVSTLLILIAVGLFILSSIRFGTPATRPSRPTREAVLGPVLILGWLGVLTAYNYWRGRRAYVQGVLIGIGVAALIEGACFTIHIRF